MARAAIRFVPSISILLARGAVPWQQWGTLGIVSMVLADETLPACVTRLWWYLVQ